MDIKFRIYASTVLSALAFYIIAFPLGERLSVFTIDTFVYNTSIAMAVLIGLVSIVQLAIYRRFKVISFYLGILQGITFFMLTLISFPTSIFPLFLVSFILETLGVAVVSSEVKERLLRTAVPIISLAVMIYLGNLFQFAFNRPDTGIVVASTESVFVALGQNIPFLEFNGLFVFSRHFDLILSFQQYIMFMAISVLISENYYQIIGFVRRRGRRGGKTSMVVYGLTGALSCQCESYISFLPAFSILLVNYILFPAIIFSIILLIATYSIVSRRYDRGSPVPVFSASFYRNRKLIIIAVSSIILLGTPVFITVVVYLSLLRSALFFFLTGMIMVLDGYVLMVLLSRVFMFTDVLGRAKLPVIIAGTLLAFMWFYPPLTVYAFNFPPYFVLMNVSMLISGITYGFVHSVLSSRWKDVLNEYISAMYGIFSLIVFYVMVTFQVSIWKFFTIDSQIEFVLLTWTIMLPVMWVTTQVSLNRLASDTPGVNQLDSLKLGHTPA